MSSPFSSAGLIGKPTWTTPSVPNGNFMPVTVGGVQIYEEVGYGEGGYGQGGYDAPSQTFPGSSQPNWTVYTLK